MARKKNAPVLKNNLRNAPAEKFRAVNRMNGIVTMVEYTSEDDIKAYELEPTFRELGEGGSSDIKAYDVKIINTSSNPRHIPLMPGNGTLAVDNNGFIYDNTTDVTINPGEEKIIKFLGKNPYEDAPASIDRIIATGTLTSSDSEESISLITDLDNVRIESVSDYGMYTFYPVIIDTTQPASFTFDIKMLPGLPGM